MEHHKLQRLTDSERKYAVDNHNLVYAFLHRYGYSLENYYDIVIFGYLKAVQVYHRRENLRKIYDFPFISWQYMRSEIGNYFRMENARKRKPAEKIVSLDADYTGLENVENLHDHMEATDGITPESEMVESELLTEFLNYLSNIQRKIVKLKMDGYRHREIYQLLEIKPSSYYREIQRIRKILQSLVIG